MRPAIRLLPLESLPGPLNMAADEALLERAAADGVASLRFYTWAGPTLSLGYFQPADGRLADPRLAGLPWVRRSTGGTALVHHHELTYGLALPPGSPWQDGEGWACRFHRVIAAALQTAGANTRAVQCGDEKKLGDVLCFLHQTPGDLLADAAKVVGSAQRKWKGALLQHGGVLLRRSEHTPDLPGLLEQTGVLLTPAEAMKRIVTQFAADTGWEAAPGDWTPEELARREGIAREKYGSPAWNAKR